MNKFISVSWSQWSLQLLYFYIIYNEIYNLCFLFSLMSKRKSKLLTKPWITQGLLKSIKTKSKLYNALLRNLSSLNHVQYKQYRNKINHLLKISKCSYYDCKIESTKNNLKAVWKLLNTIINRRKIKSPIAKLFKDGQREIKDPVSLLINFVNILPT